jgi:predicted extracellular nuclease
MTFRVLQPFPGRLTVLATLLAGISASAFAAPGPVVISQVYGGGGNSGATHTNDFIELFNRSASPVSLNGWSVQYASATGNTWNNITKIGDVTLQPGQYYLIQEGAGAGNGVALPTPDASGTIAMAAGAGKVVLVNNGTQITDPRGATVVDLVGFGSTASAYEGTGPTPTLTNSTAALRNANGCADTDDNKADFSAGTATPRTSASPLNACAGGTPVAQPIVLTCPAGISGEIGSAFSGLLSARDEDSIVTGASITSGAVAGISLTGFVPGAAVGQSASATLEVGGSLAAGNYPVGVTFTNGDGQSASCTVNVSVSGQLKIWQIQGSGLSSAYNNTVQSTSGVITKKLSGGFFIQDPTGDGDPSTSDAIYVFGATTSAKVGDLVRVTGTVTEYTPTGAPRSYTEFKDVTAVNTVGSGYTITPANIVLGSEDLSRYEAMLVRFTAPLTVNGNNYLGDRGELVLSNGRRETPTNRYPAGSAEARQLAADNQNNLVILDDNIFVTPEHIPYLGADSTVRSGDTVTDLVGVLDFGSIGGGSGWYKLQPNEAPVFSRTNVRQPAPVVAAGNVKVASANVLNFFTTFTDGTDANGASGQGCTVGSTTSKGNCRGADNMAEFVRQRDKIVNELKAMNADAVGLMEIQNNGDSAVSYLVNALNQSIGSATYAYVPKPAATGTDAIRVAMIYKPAVLTLVGGALSDNDGINNRPPMAQTFKLNANGAKFSLIVNHLKSKGSCSGATTGDTDSGDGQGCWNGTRVKQAQRLATYFIPAVTAAAGDARVLAVGDFNSYGMEDPIVYLNKQGMVNELERFVRPAGTPYSYVFDGMSGYLDHALASTALDGQVAGVTEWHNNADEPPAIDYNLGDTSDDPYVNNAFRASDHDPVIVSLNLAGSSADVSASVKTVVGNIAYNRVSGKFSGTVSFTNTSGATLNGPLQFSLEGLPAGVTLDNKSGDRSGVPYITLPNGSLAAGATVTVNTTFTNPSKLNIVYTSKLYSGTF